MINRPKKKPLHLLVDLDKGANAGILPFLNVILMEKEKIEQTIAQHTLWLAWKSSSKGSHYKHDCLGGFFDE